MRARPAIGAKMTGIITLEVCAKCGYLLEGQLCDQSCSLDGDSHEGNTIFAKYERTDIFLGDEHHRHPANGQEPPP